MWSETLLDLRYAARGLARRPTFAAAGILCLALGVGANVTLFAAVDFFLLKGLPVHDSDRLVQVLTKLREPGSALRRNVSYPLFDALRNGATTLGGLVAVDSLRANARLGSLEEPVTGELVSDGFFEDMRVPLRLGAPLPAQDERTPGGERAVVISERFWRRALPSSEAVLGQTLFLNGELFTIVGVAAEPFNGTNFGVVRDVWISLSHRSLFRGNAEWWRDPSDASLDVLARLVPRATTESASAELRAIVGRFDAMGDGAAERDVAILPERAGLLMPNAPHLVGLAGMAAMGGVGLVLLVACANVASLLLARAVTRRREIGVRVAVGTSRGRLVRLFLAEALTLALPAAALGVIVSFWTTDIFTVFLPPLPIQLNFDLAPDHRTLVFALALALAATVAAGAVPAFAGSRTDVLAALKSGGAGGTGAPLRGRSLDAVVVLQIGVCMVLLTMAGLFMGTLRSVQNLDPGFDAEGALVVRLPLEEARYPEGEGRRFYTELLEGARSLPGVEVAALGASAPMGLVDRVRVREVTAPPDSAREVAFNVISRGFFNALGVQVVEGRDFELTEGMSGVAIVSESVARRLWPDGDAVGQHISIDSDTPRRVVGVAADFRLVELAEQEMSAIYVPFSQSYRARMLLLTQDGSGPGILRAARATRRERAGSADAGDGPHVGTARRDRPVVAENRGSVGGGHGSARPGAGVGWPVRSDDVHCRRAHSRDRDQARARRLRAGHRAPRQRWRRASGPGGPELRVVGRSRDLTGCIGPAVRRRALGSARAQRCCGRAAGRRRQCELRASPPRQPTRSQRRPAGRVGRWSALPRRATSPSRWRAPLSVPHGA